MLNVQPLFSPASFASQVAQLFRAIDDDARRKAAGPGEESRRLIVTAIETAGRPLCVGEIAETTGLSRESICNHTRIMSAETPPRVRRTADSNRAPWGLV